MKRHLYQNGKAENLPVVTGRLVEIKNELGMALNVIPEKDLGVFLSCFSWSCNGYGHIAINFILLSKLVTTHNSRLKIESHSSEI